MPRQPMDIPWPLSSAPGANPQESGGRLINVSAEPLGDANADKQVWRRQPGLTVFVGTLLSGYRGGLIVNNTSYDFWKDTAVTVSAAGVATDIGTVNGSKKISIARNQLQPSPNIIVVDPDNGAYDLTSGTAVPFTAGGILPQPNSVTFQDSYLFFSIADGRIFATNNNSLTVNALTFTTCQARSDVTLLRVIAYSGYIWAFTTASCEVYSDTAQPAPGFPYSRLAVLDNGLLQPAAIAGWETGFADLCFVSHDFGVWRLAPNQLQPAKISPPDLDRQIEAAARAGKTLDALCYVVQGKKFWSIASPDWSWEVNLNTLKWTERTSNFAGSNVRWRATSSHAAFGKWLVGDTLTGALLFVDDTNYTEVGMPLLARLESGPVAGFPNRLAIPRADFNFEVGVGMNSRMLQMTVLGAQAASNGEIQLIVNDATQVNNGDYAVVSGVGGTTEANGTWPINQINGELIQLLGSHFANAWTSGGTAVDITAPPNMVNPSVAISWSDDDGYSWGNPLVRSLGFQRRSKFARVSVKNTGTSGPQARRWRVDCTDPVWFGLFGATQATDPREY
jgi:hypothetical protein